MILLAIASVLLFFTTFFTGVFTEKLLKKLLLVSINNNFFETFLTGLITSFIYFNLVSFVLPVNYIVLIPLLLISIFTFSKEPVRSFFFSQIHNTGLFFFSKKNVFFVIPFIVLLFVHWVSPPLNWDSSQYHYIAIRWYEQFKIVPGLANVHGRLAFNPASFIISAAWSFTDLTGQALYPLNGVLALLFFAFITKKILAQSNTLYSLILLILVILLFRITLVNISSPSSDILSGILIFYCGFRTFELLKEGKQAFADYIIILLICCFSVTAKLSAMPSLLLLPLVYFIVIKKNKTYSALLKSLSLVAVIILPWLARNFLLSGYFLYPVPGTIFFHADWAVPKDVVRLDYLFSKFGPRTITVDFITMQKMSLLQLVHIWYEYMYQHSFVSLLIAIAAIASPVSWILFPILQKKIPKNQFILWGIYYTGAWVWLINSPEPRFGLPYLALSIALPFTELANGLLFKWKFHQTAFALIICFFCVYYSVTLFKKKGFYFSMQDCWLIPLKDYQYFRRNNLQTFPFVTLRNGVKLYLPDSNHDCLNAPGPCMNWRYGNIEMRGKKIEDGFRNTKDEVKKYWPFIDTGK